VVEPDVLPLVKQILDHLRDVITGPDHLDLLVAWLYAEACLFFTTTFLRQ
jgi:hypothetical protein